MSLIKILDQAYPVAQTRALYDSIKTIPRMPAGLIWIEADEMAKLEKGDEAIRKALEAYLSPEIVAFLPRHVRLVEKTYGGSPCVGYEFFLSTYGAIEPLQRAGLHIDSNEPDRETASVVWGSVFHVGPQHVPTGGGTVLCPTLPVPAPIAERCFKPNSFDELEALSGWRRIDFKENQLITFDGRLPHYADRCSAKPDEPRVAFIVTGWMTRPRFAPPAGHSYLSVSEYRAFCETAEADLSIVGNYLALRDRLGTSRADSVVSALARVATI